MLEPTAATRRDRFRDPVGWLLDKSPWPLRRVYLAVRYRSWPHESARLIGCRRPPKNVFDYFNELERRCREAGHYGD